MNSESMAMKFLGTLLLPLLLSIAPGCFWVTTKHEGETLRKDLNSVTVRVDKQEQSLGESVNKLKKTLDEASKLLARNSADLGARFGSLERENASLNGLIMEAKRLVDEVKAKSTASEARLDNLEARLLAMETKTAAKPPKSPGELYAEGMKAMKRAGYDEARDAFRTLVIRYPGHDRADDAQFQRGESYYLQKDFESALREFQSVFDKFASSPLADDALFRAGEAAEKLKWCTDARAYFGLLRQKFPKSKLARKAKQKDAVLKKNAKKKKLCQS
jgi:tol-pal system protein YbgF